MIVKEKLMQEFGCAIEAIFGDIAEEDFDLEKVNKEDLLAVAKKATFYLDL